jgi:hypothetical protein
MVIVNVAGVGCDADAIFVARAIGAANLDPGFRQQARESAGVVVTALVGGRASPKWFDPDRGRADWKAGVPDGA